MVQNSMKMKSHENVSGLRGLLVMVQGALRASELPVEGPCKFAPAHHGAGMFGPCKSLQRFPFSTSPHQPHHHTSSLN